MSRRFVSQGVRAHLAVRPQLAHQLMPAMGLMRLPVRQFAYHQNVIDHYENPRNVGSLPVKEPHVGTGLVGAPACGDVMRLQIQISGEDGETIEKAVFKTFGCGSAIASSSYVTELIEGMKISDAVKIRNTDIAQHLKLPPVKIHCSVLAEDAIKAAINDYKSKMPKLASESA